MHSVQCTHTHTHSRPANNPKRRKMVCQVKKRGERSPGNAYPEDEIDDKEKITEKRRGKGRRAKT